MIKAVVFDLDDTLVDSWSRFDGGMLPVLDAEGIPYDREEMIAKMHPQGVPPTAALFCEMGVPGTVEEVTRRLEEGMYREYAHRIFLMPGAREYLRRLRDSGVRLFVLTASPHSITDPCLQNNGVPDWFERVWTVEDYGMGKSNPVLFERVVKDIGLPADEILYYDDNPMAIVNAATAGMQVCGVLCPHTPRNAERICEVAERYIVTFEALL
ncbi:MAG: HAD family hydrolase [Clostridia bacterium]|nr:HAD family hydrolase [Clostridia bacterium]